MILVSSGKRIKAYHIVLGGNPTGHKVQQGDRRTPEGRYVIDYRNPRSRFHLFLHISYPNAQDRAKAMKKDIDPGGMIMIHGSPNHWSGAEALPEKVDWAVGCIAKTNAEIEEIWSLVKYGTPIEKQP